MFGKKVTKSFGKDYVFMRGDDKGWRQVGWYMHAAKCFSGLGGWDNSLNADMCKAIEAKKGCKTISTDAPQLDKPELVEADEDEFEG